MDSGKERIKSRYRYFTYGQTPVPARTNCPQHPSKLTRFVEDPGTATGGRRWGHSTPSWTAEFSLHCCIQGSSHHLVENQKLMTIHNFPSSSTCVKAVARPLGNQIMCWKRTIILFYSRDGQECLAICDMRYAHMTSHKSSHKVTRLPQQSRNISEKIQKNKY